MNREYTKKIMLNYFYLLLEGNTGDLNDNISEIEESIDCIYNEIESSITKLKKEIQVLKNEIKELKNPSKPKETKELKLTFNTCNFKIEKQKNLKILKSFKFTQRNKNQYCCCKQGYFIVIGKNIKAYNPFFNHKIEFTPIYASNSKMTYGITEIEFNEILNIK